MISPNISDLFYAFRDIAGVVHSSTDPREVSQLVVWKITELLGAKGAILRVINLATHEMELYAAYGLSEKYLAKGHVSSHKMIAQLCSEDRVIVIGDIFQSPRVQYPQEAQAEGIRMMVDAPLCIQDNVVGILRILFPEHRSFSEKELDFIVAVAQLTSCAMDKARLLEMQQRRYHQLALQTEKFSALGRMAAGIAHEINNPLASILLYSTNALKKAPPNTPLKETLEIIVSETIRCRSIIQDLLEFSRDREPQKSLANLNRIIEKVLVLLQNEFRLHHLELRKNLAPDMPDTLLDSRQMQQVFVNILLNAVEAMKPGGEIRIKSFVDRSRGLQVAVVQDDGCGIAPENLDKIFEPFFSTKPKGTGLGLAVSYGIVKAHGGELSVESEPGKGTRFTISLPLG
ncbi:GAF domain-containing protein [Desulfacinum infernum DSM 9756]|uniref:histidine kinase n=1 Tax=Desulfacinum infernum DSM 9756 TaxID=1121391 RepID=A0A1M5I5F4_9BACT|nr:sensor histidine kinase [Desulfacinum infernum]SHG23462.1 GAF domain-containing protein [Desulfacinum infernum DSM 9756]